MSPLGSYFNEYDVSDRYEGKANLSKVAGKHTLKFGGMYGMGKYFTRASDNNTGSYSSSVAFTQGPNPSGGKRDIWFRVCVLSAWGPCRAERKM